MGLQPHAPAVVSETIDGEVIVIHLERGSYFSLRGSAADVWALVEQGCAEAQIPEALTARYPAAAPGDVAEEVARFLRNLREEGLVVDGDGAPASAPELEQTGSAFDPPRLEKYTDLQDLIMLDPIHEVEPEGWPAPREST
jgi:coenzyme PQQ synthesis protein D (PqqD)